MDGLGDHPTGVRIVNHEMLDCSDERELGRLAGLPRYQARSLCITRPEDLIQLNPMLQSDYDWAQRHYARIGLPVSTNVLWDDSFERLAEFPGHGLDVFLFGRRAHSVRPDAGRFEVVAEMNQKNLLIQRSWHLGTPTPFTQIFDSKHKLGDLGQYQYPLFLKLSISVSGLGVWGCETPDKLAAQLRQIDDDVPLQLQQPVDAEFLNVQYFGMPNGKFKRVLVTEQILDGNAHAGNRPTHHKSWAVTDPLAVYMVKNGMRGIFAFDVAALKNGNYLVIECNPRYNGASYPTIVSQRLGVGNNWMARNFATNVASGSAIDLGEFEYNPTTNTGAVLMNWGIVPEGKVGYMVVGTPDQQRVIADAIATRLV
jgi:hypothetical protein